MSKLQKWCPNYTQVCTLLNPADVLPVPRGTPLVSPPLGAQFLCWQQTSFGGIPRDNAKVLVFPTCLPTTGEGWPKGMRHENACLLRWPKPRLPLPLPTKTLIKFQETGKTVTHSLRVLHSLQWHQPSKDERALRPKPSPWLATPTPTLYLGLMMIMSQALVAYL